MHTYISKLTNFDVLQIYYRSNQHSNQWIFTFRFLDLSQSTKETGTYPRPVTALHRIVTCLRSLTHLDISSTNLASQPSTYDRPVKG